MTDPPPRPGLRQPKLRASCDRCGTAKLRCDRQHPECGRCISLGADCVYGVSRKSNRRPVRVKQTDLPGTSGISFTAGMQAGGSSMDIDAFCDGSSSRSSVISELGPFPNPAPLHMNEAVCGDMVALSLEAFSSTEMEEWGAYAEYNSGPSHMPPSSASPKIAPKLQGGDPFGMTRSPGISNTHDCVLEACLIWGSLISLNNEQTAVSQVTVPLDDVLKACRDACERLSRLLVCSCARAPHLALLYAATLCRVQSWYQQAVGCAPNPPPKASAATPSVAPGASVWPFLDSGGLLTPTLNQPTVAHSHMAVGSFAIDDDRTQTALKIQLIFGEMRRSSTLIDLFASQCSAGPSDAKTCSFGGVDSLYRSLSTWLKGEHVRTVGIVKSRLADLSESGNEE